MSKNSTRKSGARRAKADSGLGSGSAFASSTDSMNRTSTVWMPKDTRREINYQNRLELVKKSRWLFNNLGLFRRLINGTTRYTIGRGLMPIPTTSDKQWNTDAKNYFYAWAQNKILCDVRGQMTWWKMQGAALRCLLKDGETFFIQAASGDETIDNGAPIPGRPQLQWLETQQIGNAGGSSDMDTAGYREGIQINSLGRALNYRVMVDKDPRLQDLSDSRIVPAESMIHVFESERATQVHGLPWAYSGSNSGVDMLDLNSLEKAAVKLHSTLAGSITRKTPDAKKGFAGNVVKVKDAGGQKVTNFENFMGGAAVLQLATDEEFKLMTSTRPSATWIGFMDYLVRDIAYGFGVSPEFIWSVAGLGGANARFILQDSEWFFDELRQLIIDSFCQRVYVWVIARAMKRGELRACNDPVYWKVNWQGPPKITVDSGREGNLEIEKLRMGLTSWEQYYAARGQSGEEAIDFRIEEIRRTMAKCATAGVPFELIFPSKPGTSTTQTTGTISDPNNPDAEPMPVDVNLDTKDVEDTAQPTNAPAAPGGKGGKSQTKFELVQQMAEAYGSAVRAGAVTPNLADEKWFRDQIGLPDVTSDVTKAWKDDGGARRPVTLKSVTQDRATDPTQVQPGQTSPDQQPNTGKTPTK